ncbi:hypothetical protein EV401DRAFT_2200224 [Pisolithus croceorrhizus]|nr:hypothetical protein EV401DRAFT_2200224 [Pisolithus croceorrhizus]
MLHTSERNRRPVRELRFRILNLIVGKDVTRDSPDAEVCTHHTTRYEATIESMKVHIWEVSGFNQPKKDPKKNAPDIEDKFRPILEAKASVNVVLFCIRDQKLTGMTMRIFELIHGILGTSISGTRHVCVTGLRNAGYEGKWRELREELVAVLIEYGPARGRTAVPLEPALRYYLGRSGQTDGGWLTRLRRRLGLGGASLTVSATVCWSKGAKNATGCAAVNALDGGLEYLADVRGQRVVFSSHNYSNPWPSNLQGNQCVCSETFRITFLGSARKSTLPTYPCREDSEKTEVHPKIFLIDPKLKFHSLDL